MDDGTSSTRLRSCKSANKASALRNLPKVAIVLQPPKGIFRMDRPAIGAKFSEQAAQFVIYHLVGLLPRLTVQYGSKAVRSSNGLCGARWSPRRQILTASICWRRWVASDDTLYIDSRYQLDRWVDSGSPHVLKHRYTPCLPVIRTQQV